MPAANICLGCNHLYTPTPNTPNYGRCPTCRPAYIRDVNAKRGPRTNTRNTTPKRQQHQVIYRSSAWRKLRQTILRRDGCCTNCGSITHLQVHHMTSISEAPDRALDPDNLQTLCKSCHAHVSNLERRRTR